LTSDSGDQDLEAAEYVIGTLDADERVAFAERLSRDAAARSAVAAWHRRLADLALAVEPIEPPQSVWTRIERETTSAQLHPFRVISGGHAARADEMKRSRDRWRIAAVTSGLVAAALIALTLQRTATPLQPDADYVAAVNRGGAKPALIVRVNLKTGRVFVRPVFAETPPGHSLELWYIGSDKTPRSMGVVDNQPIETTMPAGAESPAATFAISVEPLGGSKTGGPTGPVVYTGQLVKE
jgi:anti-sigma-K factor RskA